VAGSKQAVKKVAKPKAKPRAKAKPKGAATPVAAIAVAPEPAVAPAKPKRKKTVPAADGTTLVIVESPTKAKTIGKYLGRNT